MEEKNFNASEFPNTVKIIERLGGGSEGSVGTGRLILALAQNIGNISQEVESDDSPLSDTLNSLKTTLETLSSKLNNISTEIIKEIENYAEIVLSLEMGTTKTLVEIDFELDDINNALAALDNVVG